MAKTKKVLNKKATPKTKKVVKAIKKDNSKKTKAKAPSKTTIKKTVKPVKKENVKKTNKKQVSKVNAKKAKVQPVTKKDAKISKAKTKPQVKKVVKPVKKENVKTAKVKKVVKPTIKDNKVNKKKIESKNTKKQATKTSVISKPVAKKATTKPTIKKVVKPIKKDNIVNNNKKQATKTINDKKVIKTKENSKQVSSKTKQVPQIKKDVKPVKKPTSIKENKTFLENTNAFIASQQVNKNEEQELNVEKETKKKDKKFTLSLIINIILILCLLVVGFLYLKSNDLIANKSIENEVIRKLPKEVDPIFEKTYREFYEKAYVKDDYVGQIIFESGIINEPILQGDTNETYLRRNYETYKYEICGPVFMDYICDRDTDQNLILYGHNRSTRVDPEHEMMFSPLHVLEKQENYENNKVIYLAMKDRVDVYLVAAVYPAKVVEKEDGNQYLVKGEPKYYLNNYGVEEFDLYSKSVKQKQLYDTGVEISNTDKLLTLQTCYEDKLDKLIILAKKISSMPY